MSIKSRFLTLSMKEQICLTIVVLTAFCILVILSICCSLSYEFLKQDYKQKKLYFFNKYRDYIESSFFFKNFCLLQYEEIIRRIINQAYNFLEVYNDYFTTDFDNYSNKMQNYNDSLHYNIKENKTDDPVLYTLCYFETNFYLNHDSFCKEMFDVTLLHYQAMVNTFIYHDIYDFFRIPGYNIPLIDSQLYVSINLSTIFSFNTSVIHDVLMLSQGYTNTLDYSKINQYFHKKLNDIVSRIQNENILFYLYEQSDYFEHIFSNVFSKIKLFLKKDSIDNGFLYEYLSNIHYGNNTFSQINYEQNLTFFFYSEIKLINNFFYFLLNRISLFLDSYYIPLFHENSTIVSQRLCFLFLLNQIKFQIDKNNIKELLNAIKKGKSYFENCFVNNTEIKFQKDIIELLNLNFASFLNLNNLILQGLMYLSNNKDGFPFYFIKYTYPNYNVLKDFRTEFLLLDQTDFYLFTSFQEPIKYSNYILRFTENGFLFIVIIIVYIWFLCLLINLLIFNRVIKKWTNPIEKLQDAVESSSIIDDNIFKYEFDDIINELFGTCKELLSGQINNNDNGLKNFNILSQSKEKKVKIDKNIYKKNLIINNDIMNKLIDQQQNMMDFSNNIKLNELNNIHNTNTINNINENEKSSKKKKINNLNTDTNSEKNVLSFCEINNNNNNSNNKKSNQTSEEKDKNSKKKRLNDLTTETTSEKNFVSSFENKIKHISNNNNSNGKKNKLSEEKDNEPYIKLFKIAEYLNAQRNKIEPNNIFIISNNSIINESKMSKIVSKNNKNIINNSIKKNASLKSSILQNEIGGNNENIYINMHNEQNISYLWYMEEKKKNNKSFNYQISENYKELFVDYK